MPSGDYEVKLLFGENAAAITGPGQRLIDVNLEGGALELDNHDIWATVGALNIPDTQTFQTTVTDGVLDFDLIAQTNIAGIRGIQISPLSEPGANVAPTITATPNPATATAGQVTTVDLTTNDANGDPVTTSITAGPAFASIVGGDLRLAPGTGDIAGSPYTVTVQASDGDLSSTVNVTVNVSAAGAPLFRVNTGGATLAATDGGPSWLGITAAGTSIPGLNLSGNVTGPTTNTNTFAPLTGGAPNALYQSTLHTPTGTGAGTGQLNFDFTVPSGDYEVKLFFGENAAAITGAGQRLFDVNLEGGALELDNHDIWATVGGLNIPDIQTLETTVTDGVLDLDLIAQTNIAGIRGIQISPLVEPGTNVAPTITATPNPVARWPVRPLTSTSPPTTPTVTRSRPRSPPTRASRLWSAVSCG